MNRNQLLISSLIGLLLLNMGLLALVTFGSPPPIHHLRRREGPKRMIIKRLSLEADQIQAYEQLVVGHQKQIRSLQRKVKSTKRELYQELLSDPAPRKDSLLQQLAALQLDIEQTHYAHFSDIKALCRPDQIPLFHALSRDLADYFSPKPLHNR